MEDKPFNPFYIGPHPSKACAIPEVPGQQCNPACVEKSQASGQQPPQSGPGGGILIVGISGPSGGVANVYSTGQMSNQSKAAAPVTTGTAAPGRSLAATASAPVSVGIGTSKPGPSLVGNAAPASTNRVCRPYPCMENKNSNGPGC
ncbi:uncharacterized protein LOC111068682 [Drosophila obscura]|uniref:uncharacterized protein LOC111068682 n=1 Tax=Drosophila obscura TaxID=7282 RepID=UPI000BA16135|nr:uncharacterized protein LOC111068682 [Drosophila obscura]